MRWTSRYEAFAYNQTRTSRSERRREIRRLLGTSSDGAPDAMQALLAVNQLDLLLRDASGGEFMLEVKTRRGEILTPLGAIGCLRGAADAREVKV